MKHTAKVTTVLAIFAKGLACSKTYQDFTDDMKILSLCSVATFLEDHYGLLEDEELYEEFEKRFYESIVVPWLDITVEEEE